MRDLRVMSIGRATRLLHCVTQCSRCRAEPKPDCSAGAVWRREAREEAPPGIVVATDIVSVNADCDNGTVAVYGTPRYRWRVEGYTLATLNIMARQPIDEVEN